MLIFIIKKLEIHSTIKLYNNFWDKEEVKWRTRIRDFVFHCWKNKRKIWKVFVMSENNKWAWQPTATFDAFIFKFPTSNTILFINLSTSLFLLRLLIATIKILLSSSILAKCCTHINQHNFRISTMSGPSIEGWIFILFHIFHSLLSFSLPGPHINLKIFFSKILNFASLEYVRDHASYLNWSA